MHTKLATQIMGNSPGHSLIHPAFLPNIYIYRTVYKLYIIGTNLIYICKPFHLVELELYYLTDRVGCNFRYMLDIYVS